MSNKEVVTNGVVTNGAVPNGTAPRKDQGMVAYRAPSLLQPHRARQAFADAHIGRIPPLIGFYCGVSCPPIAKIVAQFGYDLVWIDWEHSSCNVETMTQVSRKYLP
jgi:4-hydroxy-2-oxoheptanedioate aldolase